MSLTDTRKWGKSMNRIMMGAVALIGATAPGYAVAQTQTGFGSAVLETLRNCPPSPTTACDGRGTGQGIVARASDGGEGKSATKTFSPGGGNNAFGAVLFTGIGFPEMKASVTASGLSRISTALYGFQTYTYTGTTALSLELFADFHINGSSTDNRDGTFPGGAIAAAAFAVWKTSDFNFFAQPDYAGDGGFSTAASLYNQGYLFGAADCAGLEDGSPTALAINYQSQTLTGGEAHVEVSQDVCNNANPLDDALIINPGDTFVVAAFAQVIANRNAFVNATGTFDIGFSSNMSATDIAAFQANTSFASGAVAGVPEPTTWAMLMLGFGGMGVALRRRSPARARICFA